MIELIYKNDQERTIFFGGANAPWKLVTVKGLGWRQRRFPPPFIPVSRGGADRGEHRGAHHYTHRGFAAKQ